MENLPKRLIEVDLPIRRISEHARREKSIRHGHISTLHIWWARRPLAACRAALCALLWPDPADPNCPQTFIDTAKQEMLAWTPHEKYQKMSLESRSRFEKARQDQAVFAQLKELRMALFDFIADFANWDNSTDTDYLATARALTQCAHEALGGLPGTRPLVVDSFAGGGSIPLEALRVGGDAFASDLNPIPVLLNKVILEYIPKYGQRLADEVRKWGQWIKEEAEKELTEFYPIDEDGSTPIAYLWARTIISEDPGQGSPPIEVPLMRSLWLSKKTSNRKALRWKRDGQNRVKCEIVEVTYTDGRTLSVRRPLLEIFRPEKEKDVENGTVARGSATCPVTGYTTPVASVREQMKIRRGGTNDARLFCVVTTKPGQKGRFFRLPTETDLRATVNAGQELEKRIARHLGELSLVPDEPTPDTNGHRAVASVQLYGLYTFGDLFTSRQLLALTTLVRFSRHAYNEYKKDDNTGIATALFALLCLCIGKHADMSNAMCAWEPFAECPRHLFGRQAIGMIWDYGEGNFLSASSGGWSIQPERMAYSLEEIGFNWKAGQVNQASADSHPLPNDTAQCFFTDPPYYDAVPYADLSDFFYVWFKRILGAWFPDLFREKLTDKDRQAIVLHPNKQEEKKIFEKKMCDCMNEGCRILSPNGIGCVVFAHKSTAGWEAQLQAMVDAGWTITASWPIDTEMGSRINAMGTASLASSIHLVVRPRAANGHDAVGDWRDVLEELPNRINAWLPRLAEEGVVGADAIFSCLGPALEIYSRYDQVEKASGEIVTLREYLEQVWMAVSRAALSTIVTNANLSSFEPDARLTALWLWTVVAVPTDRVDPHDVEDNVSTKIGVSGYTLEYDTARKIAQGLGAHLDNLASIIEIKGDKATLLPVSKRTEYLFGKGEITPQRSSGRRNKTQQADLFAELMVREPEVEYFRQEKTVGNPGETLLDRVHQSMILFATGRSEALKRFLLEDGVGQEPGLWELSQALSALYPGGSEEKRWVDGVLARKKGLGL